MKKRILTGDRPTGKLHLGHYVGSLKNRVAMQDEYEMFIMVADVQALTDNFDNPDKIRANVLEGTMDNLAAGVDPEKVNFFIQSQVPEIAELTVFFMNLVNMGRVLRNPTVKDEIVQKGFGDDVPVGFVNYPISQAADILFLRTNMVPTGEDQKPMLELTRDIAEKFNRLYGQVFPIPEIRVGEIGRLVGTDGNAKMSKSIGNTIYLSDPPDEVEKKVMSMYTDPTRIKATDPGHIENNPVFIYLDAFGADHHQQQIQEFKDRYVVGTVGDTDVKKFLAEVLNEFLEPIRQRRAEYEAHPEKVEAILKKGLAKARAEAVKTMELVRKAMKIDYFTVDTEAKPEGSLISIDDFAKCHLKVGTVSKAEAVENSEKLIKLEIDLGEDSPRQVLTGMRTFYDPEYFVGRQVVIIANLEPRKMMGVESQGMLLAADGDKPILLMPTDPAANGAKIK